MLPIAVGVRRRVATLEAHLVHPAPAKLVSVRKESLVDRQAARHWIGVDLRQPTADALGEELVIPGTVERVGEINPTTIATYLHHLRTAGQSL